MHIPLCFARVLVVSTLFSGLLQNGTAAIPDLIPQPGRVDSRPGAFVLTAATTIVASSPAEKKEADRLAASLAGLTALVIPVRSAPAASNTIQLELDRTLEARLGPEGYLLVSSPDGVILRAATEAGLFYSGITLGQLLSPRSLPAADDKSGPAADAKPGLAGPTSASASWPLPCVEIEDKPQFPWRGLLIDVGRHYMPVEFLKKAVDLLALHKLNVLQLHLTDDQGWRLEIKKYPRLTQIGSIRKESPRRGEQNQGDGTPYGPFFYSQDQIRDLVDYAGARHVNIVPEIEMPGHFLAALAAYPEFSCRGGPFQVRTRWGVEEDILCAGNDGALAFAQDILTEVLELFPSRFIHIGGDEAPRTRWKECPKCQARMQSEGLKNEAELQTYFNRAIERFLTAKGRRLIGWDEILEGGLTPRAAVMSWRGVKGGIAAASAGHDVVMSPNSHCYFDYAQSQSPGEPESIGGFIPLETVYNFAPVPAALAIDKRQHILGTQGNVWTEYLHSPADVEYFAFPRAAALAEVLWSPVETRDFGNFLRRLQTHQKRLDQWTVNYRRLDNADPQSK